MNCGVGHRHDSDLALLWLWHRLAAVAPLGPIAWEPPYAESMALKKKNLFESFLSVLLGIYPEIEWLDPWSFELIEMVRHVQGHRQM